MQSYSIGIISYRSSSMIKERSWPHIQRCQFDIDTGILFNNGDTIAFFHKNIKTVDLVDFSHFHTLRSITLPSFSPPPCQPVISAHPIVLAKMSAVYLCGGDYSPNGPVVEISDAVR